MWIHVDHPGAPHGGVPLPEVGEGRGWSQNLRIPKDTIVLNGHFHNLKPKKIIPKKPVYSVAVPSSRSSEGLLDGLESRDRFQKFRKIFVFAYSQKKIEVCGSWSF